MQRDDLAGQGAAVVRVKARESVPEDDISGITVNWGAATVTSQILTPSVMTLNPTYFTASTFLNGRLEAAVVNAGNGSTAEFAAIDAAGKIAFMRREATGGLTPAQKVANAACRRSGRGGRLQQHDRHLQRHGGRGHPRLLALAGPGRRGHRARHRRARDDGAGRPRRRPRRELRQPGARLVLLPRHRLPRVSPRGRRPGRKRLVRPGPRRPPVEEPQQRPADRAG